MPITLILTAVPAIYLRKNHPSEQAFLTAPFSTRLGLSMHSVKDLRSIKTAVATLPSKSTGNSRIAHSPSWCAFETATRHQAASNKPVARAHSASIALPQESTAPHPNRT
jgi:hypothetical protein